MTPKTEEKICKLFLWVTAAFVLLALALIIGQVVSRGIVHINWEFLTETPRRGGEEGGVLSPIVATIYLAIVSLFLATPIGVGAAIFLTEYAPQGKLLWVIRFTTESLAGIPSIIFGIFGFTFFVIFLQMGWSILSGSLTLFLMILPTIVRTAEEAINAVPKSFREGSFALGATRWQTIVKVILPPALPGIVTGLILGLGRVVGETAAVMLTAGSALMLPRSLLDPGRSMSLHLYILAIEGISMERAYATGTVLIITIIIINFMVNLLIARRRVNLR